MQEAEIRRVLNYVWTNLNCPRCDSKLDQGEIFMVANTKNFTVFDITCPVCKVNLKVNGVLPADTRHYLQQRTTKTEKLNLTKLKEFRGQNISELFQ